MNNRHTLKESIQPIEATRFFRTIDRIKNYDLTSHKNQLLYVFGHTFAPQRNLNNIDHAIQIKQFKKQYGLLANIIPIPSPHSFLLKLSSPKILHDTFDALDEYVFFNVVLFNNYYEKKFLENFDTRNVFASNRYPKKDPSYFMYGADFDHNESDTGIMEFFSYGKNAPDSLTVYL